MDIRNEVKITDKDFEKKKFVVRNAADVQRAKLDKLMKNPEKPVIIPEGPKERDFSNAIPSFVRNVMGSSAGAGSGEFHVYRHLRRKEYARQKHIQEKSRSEQLDEDFRQRLEQNRLEIEEKTAKKRAKRLKKKAKQKANRGKKPKKEEEEEKNDSDSDSDPEDETEDVKEENKGYDETEVLDRDENPSQSDQDVKKPDEKIECVNSKSNDQMDAKPSLKADKSKDSEKESEEKETTLCTTEKSNIKEP